MSILYYQFSIITPLAIHETTHINQVDTKDDLAEMKATGINSAEENLAEHVEDRISDKIDTDSEKFTDEEMDEYLNGLEAENEEKGREQKSLAQGTEAAKDVSEENKENNAIPIGAPTDPISLGLYFTLNKTDEQKKADEQLAKEIVEWFENGVTFYVDGAKKIWEFVLDDGTKGTFDKEAFDKLPEDQKALFYEANPTLKNLINESSWGPVDESTYRIPPFGENKTEEELKDLQKQGGFVLDNPSIPDIGEDTSKEDYEESSKQEGIPLEDNSGAQIFTARDWEKVNKEIENGTFVDSETEQEYDIYVKNKIKEGKEARTREGWVKAKDTWNTNRLQGEEFHNEKFEEFKQKTNEAKKEITIIVEDEVGNKVRTRVDAIGLDKETGEVVIEEYKSSETAPLTKNQEKAFPLINSNGGKVVGEGKGIFTDGYEIKKGTKVKEIRKKEVKDE